MQKYKILAEGQNYHIKIEKNIQKFGFFTTRYIESINLSDAKIRAINLLNNELQEISLNDKADPPIIRIDECTEIESFDDCKVPGSGFTWYKDEDSKT